MSTYAETLQELVELYAEAQQWYKSFVGRSSYDARFCMTLPCTCFSMLTTNNVVGVPNNQLIRLDVDPEVLKKYAEEHPTDAAGFMHLILVTTASFADSFVNGSVLLFKKLNCSVQRITYMSYLDDESICVILDSDADLIVYDYVKSPK